MMHKTRLSQQKQRHQSFRKTFIQQTPFPAWQESRLGNTFYLRACLQFK